jgi:hypothetical protein
MKRQLIPCAAIVAAICGQAFSGSVIDDAKFKLDLRGDPNGNATYGCGAKA